MNVEQEIINAFERGKGFGIAEGMKSMRLKELTDEEILEVIRERETTSYMNFARAILRKAQEK
jgi:hypothetical protein